MRRNSRIDRNQPEIIRALRQAGATVQSLSAVRDGCPDLLVGFQGKNFVMEVKDGDAKPSLQKMTPDEFRWQLAWNGRTVVVRSISDALKEIGL